MSSLWAPLVVLRRLVVRLLCLLRLASHVSLTHATETATVGSDKHGRKRTLADLLRSCPSLFGPDATYVPPPWLSSGHLTTIWAAMANFTRVNVLQYERHHLALPDGGTICLDWTPKIDAPGHDARTPILVCIHGLTGGSHESYVRRPAFFKADI
jgi:hypothetical protein